MTIGPGDNQFAPGRTATYSTQITLGGARLTYAPTSPFMSNGVECRGVIRLGAGTMFVVEQTATGQQLRVDDATYVVPVPYGPGLPADVVAQLLGSTAGFFTTARVVGGFVFTTTATGTPAAASDVNLQTTQQFYVQAPGAALFWQLAGAGGVLAYGPYNTAAVATVAALSPAETPGGAGQLSVESDAASANIQVSIGHNYDINSLASSVPMGAVPVGALKDATLAAGSLPVIIQTPRGALYTTDAPGSSPLTRMGPVLAVAGGIYPARAAPTNLLAVGASAGAGGPLFFPRAARGGPVATPGATAALGAAVALSADGSLAAVGAPGHTVSATAVGAVYVFTDTAAAQFPTVQRAMLLGTGASGAAAMGTSVAVSAAGDTLAAGAPGDAAGVGAVWVFVNDPTLGWTQQGSKLTGVGAVGAAAFGTSVALSADGNTLMVGGPGDTVGAGAVWFFTRTGSTWDAGVKSVAPSPIGTTSAVGTSVTITADGTSAVVGGPGDDTAKGAVWVYQNVGGVWFGFKIVFTGLSVAGDRVGTAVAATGLPGTATVAAGAPGAAAGDGAVFLLVSGLTPLRLSAPVAGAAGAFGTSLAFSGGGRTLLVGAPDAPAAYGYVATSSTVFVPVVGLTTAVPTFGTAVALSANGDVALIGTPAAAGSASLWA